VPWYLVVSVVVSVAVGVGTYVTIRDLRRASLTPEAPARAEPLAAPARAPVAEPTPEPVVDPEPPPAPIEDSLERLAVDPPAVDDPSKDKVQFGTPAVGGGLARAEVERTIRRYTTRYERCTRRASEVVRLRSGTLRLLITIAPDGVVSQLAARSDVAPELETCVLDTIRRLRFDRSPDGTTTRVVYPILFWRADGGDAADPP